mgnify:CR=1 FL=1
MKFILATLAGICSAYDAESKVVIDLYYESQCPACRNQVSNNFKKAMETKGFLNMATVNFHPYGNARERLNAQGSWDFTCQHGVAECQYNLLEACALNYQTDQIQTFEFLACVEGKDTRTNYDTVAN